MGWFYYITLPKEEESTNVFFVCHSGHKDQGRRYDFDGLLSPMDGGPVSPLHEMTGDVPLLVTVEKGTWNESIVSTCGA